MSEPFLAEIRIMAFGYPPKGWAICNGQFLPINQNQALFALLGTTFGGNGQTTFALPNLQGRVPIHMGPTFSLGQSLGANSHTVNQTQMPAHMHWVNASANKADASGPEGHVLAAVPSGLYAAPSNLVALSPSSVSNYGGSQPHENRQPFLVLSFCIALVGIFPSQN